MASRRQAEKPQAWLQDCQQRKASLQRKTHFDNVPVKPQRVYEEMNQVFGKDTCYVSTIGLSQIAGAQFLHVYKPRHWINCGQAGPLGWTIPAALGVVKADPNRKVVALSGDYDFQFMIEELAVGAQFKLPYIHVVVNNSYLGLIRQAQRGFDMDYCVQLSFDNLNAPELNGYGVDHVAVAEGLGCKALRVFEPARSPCPAQGRRADRRVQGAGDRRDHPGARDQHLHGHRDQRRQRIRRPGAGRQRRANGDFAARLTIDRPLQQAGSYRGHSHLRRPPCRVSQPTCPCCSPNRISSPASKPPPRPVSVAWNTCSRTTSAPPKSRPSSTPTA
jgi:tartronate-semialdehyde synthase